jgi:abortive infection bacteriophage resistance protein
MDYNKQAISINEQLAKLKAQGLLIPDELKAISYLSNISYYRLRAYTYPFQDNEDPEHPFIRPISFEDIINLYLFDSQFRLLVLDAIEKIEISIRTQVIYHWAINYGSHWHLDSALFRDSQQFARDNTRLQQEVNRSTEIFIDHYKKKYKRPPEPPCWMSLEVSSFGLLSQIFKNLKTGSEKEAVTKYYGLKNVGIMENWMHSFSNIRNIAAHHGRLWNRRLTAHIKLPTQTTHPFINNKMILPYKIYAPLCCIKYVLDIISPGHSFTKRMIDLLSNFPLVQEKDMGFPDKWRDELFWQL